MDLNDRTVLVLGGAGLVGMAVSRRVLEQGPRRLVVASLRESEAEEAVSELAGEPGSGGVELVGVWGDLFVPESMKDLSRGRLMSGDPDVRSRLVDDIFGELTDEVLERSTLGALLLAERPDVVVDCVNTAGAMAYQNVFASAEDLRRKAAEGAVDREAVERHLATLYLPQLIRHVQVALEGMKRAGTRIYVKIGTSGTGGMGLNIPFTHSEERPSRVLLSKAGLAGAQTLLLYLMARTPDGPAVKEEGLAGAQTLLLYLMARTPDGPAVKEIKPTAAISWKSIGYGPIRRSGRTLTRSDAVEPVPVEQAFGTDARGWKELDEPLEGVYLDAGENGLFTGAEFEVLTSLGLMEYVTPEEIADNVLREIQGHPSGKDVVSALDGATMGPTYRAGVLRRVALERMEALEARHGVTSVAYEMLGPPRLSKLLFEAHLLERAFGTLEAAADLDPEEAAQRLHEIVRGDDDLRQRILTIGLPVLLPDGETLLRGAVVKVPWEPRGDTPAGRTSERGWVDLRPSNLERWRERCRSILHQDAAEAGPDEGSRSDHDPDADGGARIRPGRLAAWILRYEEKGERVKR